MKNVSNAFKKVIKDGGPFYAYAKVTLSNGTQLELNSKDDFYIEGNNYTESSESGFPLGVAVAKTIDIGIDNSDERFSGYDFYYARIAFYTEADLEDGRKERILEGTFTVVDSVAPGDTIEFTASNDMYKADITYVPKASFPTTALIFLKDVCTQCGMRLGDASFVNDDFEIRQKPDGLTCRQAIGYVAQIAGGNAVVDANNNLHIKSYQSLGITNTDLISGGTFKQELNKKISGGVFGQDTDYLITSGDFNTTDNYIMLTDFTSDPDVGTDDVTITGLSTEVESEDENNDTSTLIYGTDNYCLKIDNPLIKGNEEEALRMIGDILIGLSVRPFSGSFFPNPTIEFMDPVYLVDRKNNVYRSFVSSFTFNYLGDCKVSNDTESPERNKGTYYSNATEVYRKAKEEVQKNKTEWEKAMEELANRVNNSSGLYMTKEEQEDGSSIYYMHDKPTLEESMIVWKMTAEAMAVSTDGGKTWNAGLTVDGTLITKIMNTIGLNFDWGVGGTLIIQTPSGEQTLYVNAETGEVRIVANSFTLKGKSIEEIVQENTESYVDAVLPEKVKAMSTQYFGDYMPNASNEPAVNWKTEEEKKAHLNDLFYYSSDFMKGKLYRWIEFSDSGVYLWEPFEDNDIEKAMSAASTAQDTADGKRRVFTSTPFPPYDVGDLWAQGTDGDLMRCKKAKESGDSYASTDWEKASKYTDDTKANEAYDYAVSKFNVTNNAIIAEVTRAKNAESVLSSSIEINANAIKQKVSAGEVESIIEQNADSIRLRADRISWDSTYSSMTSSGKFTCEEATINGAFTSEELYGGKRKGITIEEGTIRGFYGSTTTGLLDLSAMYDDGDRHVALKGYDYLHLQAGTEILVEDYVSFIDSVYFNNSVEFTNWVYFTSDVEFEYKSHFRKAPELYNLDHVSSGGHIVFGSDGVTLAYLASSSKRYKNHVKDMTDRDAEKLLDIHVVWFKYKDGYLSQTDHMCGKEIPGFYAEELNDVIPDVVQYDKNGKPEDWNYRAMIPYMVQLLKKQNEEIKELKNEVNKLKGMIRSD
jgi:hypothetical protein|nr:MAG TPA: Putative tail protein [Caudoviricetes sp.]